MHETRFTEYGAETAGLGYHTVTAERDENDNWALALRFTPWSGGDASEIATDIVAPQSVRYPDGTRVAIRPSAGANALVQRVLGTAWAALDKGRGYTVDLAIR